MPYPAIAFMSVLIFALVHIFAEKTERIEFISRGRFLSFGGGVAIAYVFVDLLPKLAKSDLLVRAALEGIFPYFERHVYVMALLGFLLFFVVDKSRAILRPHSAFWLSLSSYALFNFLVGYAVVDKDDPDVQPLILFTFAMALHYFTNDFSLSEEYGDVYRKVGKWILVCSLFFGWFVGALITLPPTTIALIGAFIGGGIIMNVTRHELPKGNPHSLAAFLISAAFYTTILLSIG